MRRQAEDEAVEGKMAHFRGVDINELTEEDRVMWQTVEDNWRKGQDKIREHSDLTRMSGSESRKYFASYLGNLIMRKMALEIEQKGEL